MKKIININLSGRLIPIEDSAYDILKGYTESLRRYFAQEEGRDEIISDIESRIAELFQDKIKKGAHCITDVDVEDVMRSIGRPEDFAAEEEGARGSDWSQTETASSHASSTSDSGSGAYAGQQIPKSRLVRNQNDKLLGGVCSGIAHSLKVDPSLTRIVFALITLGAFGTGLIIYLILWAVLPKASLQENVSKKLFRNPDEKVIGGVAGGLAAYFNIEVWIPRLIFAAPLILNLLFGIAGTSNWFWFGPSIVFGSFTGTFILVYIVLWVVVPMATTTSDRLQMKGQKVDLENIKNTVKEELSSLKGRAQKAGSEISERAKTFAETTGKNIAQEATQAARPVATGLGHVIGVIFKAFFLFVFGCITFALFIGLVALFGIGMSALPIKDYFLDGTSQQLLAWGTLLFFLGVPIIGMVIWLVRKIMGIKSKNNYLGYTFGALWTIGWVCVIILASKITQDFSRKAALQDSLTISQPSTQKFFVKVADPKIRVYGGWFKSNTFQFSEDSLIAKNVKLRITKSKDSLFHLTMDRSARGATSSQAAGLAEAITYGVQQQDSLLYLDNGFAIQKGTKFRAQEVVLTLEVPVGKKITIDRSVRRKLGWIDLRSDWDEDRWDDDFAERWTSDVEYIMTIGGLERTDDPANGSRQQNSSKSTNGDRNTYRYDSEAEQSADSVARKLEALSKEAEKARREMLQQKEKELKEMQDKLEEERKSIRKALEEEKKSISMVCTDSKKEKTKAAAGRDEFGNLFSPWLSLAHRL